jgi:hypothetical protein
MFGRPARLPVDINSDDKDPEERIIKYEELDGNDEVMLKERNEMEKSIKSNIEKAQKRQKERYDKIHNVSSCFSVGSLVLKKDFRRKKRKGGKLDYKWTGPYSIISCLGRGLFKLRECNSNNVRALKLCRCLMFCFIDCGKSEWNTLEEL